VAGFEHLAQIATKYGSQGETVRIHAPLQHMTKAEIAREASRLGLAAGESWSCYDPTPEGRPCGQCDSCRLRRAGFAEAGLSDGNTYDG
jgi:7-cyano-7-deazaguanine synthase